MALRPRFRIAEMLFGGAQPESRQGGSMLGKKLTKSPMLPGFLQPISRFSNVTRATQPGNRVREQPLGRLVAYLIQTVTDLTATFFMLDRGFDRSGDQFF